MWSSRPNISVDKTNSVLIEIIEIGFFRVKLPEIDLFELQSDQIINYPSIISEPSAVVGGKEPWKTPGNSRC